MTERTHCSCGGPRRFVETWTRGSREYVTFQCLRCLYFIIAVAETHRESPKAEPYVWPGWELGYVD
jgi:hypothetical protein